MWCLLVLAVVFQATAVSSAQRPPDKAFIDLAKQADVSQLDKTLSKQRLEDWFKTVVGPQATITWSTTDCGEGDSSSTA